MIEIIDYRDSWPVEFASFGSIIRIALADDDIAIHHIGSTSVRGLPAKDVIDIQLTVATLAGALEQARLESVGFWRHPSIGTDHLPPGMTLDPESLEKRVYGFHGRRVNLHVREAGRFNHRYALLCRDYLRMHPEAAAAYAEVKRQLAHRFADDAKSYYDIKDPVFDILMAGTEAWASGTGWKIPATDA